MYNSTLSTDTRCYSRVARANNAMLFLALLCTLGMLCTLAACGNNQAPGGGAPTKSVGSWQSIRMFDSTHGWASTDQAILRTGDGGQTWQDVTPWQVASPWGHVVDFVNADLAWVVQQGNKDKAQALAESYLTTNGGQTWQAGSVPDTVSTYSFTRHDATVESLSATSSTNLWVVVKSIASAMRTDEITTDYVHVLQSVDGGKTWLHVLSSPPGSTNTKLESGGDTWVQFISSKVGWVSGVSPLTIDVTHDGGKSWTPQTLGTTRLSPTLLETTHNAPPTFVDARYGVLPVLSSVGATAQRLYFTTHDAGNTWQEAGEVTTQGSSDSAFASSSTWYIPAIDTQYKTTTLYVTSDGGQHWRNVKTTSGYLRLGALDFLSSALGWAVGSNIPIRGKYQGDASMATAPLVTKDGGQTWKALTYTVA